MNGFEYFEKLAIPADSYVTLNNNDLQVFKINKLKLFDKKNVYYELK